MSLPRLRAQSPTLNLIYDDTMPRTCRFIVQYRPTPDTCGDLWKVRQCNRIAWHRLGVAEAEQVRAWARAFLKEEWLK